MNKPTPYTPENMIKGRIAEAIVEELLKDSGNDVYRFGYESILQNLVQRGSNFDRRNKNAHQVKSIPDFVVLNSEGNNFFLEVKFRANPDWLRRDQFLRRTTEYWQPKLILVTVVKPYFRIVTPESLLDECCSFEPLETDPDLHITHTVLETFERLVERFLVNGKTNANIRPGQDYPCIKDFDIMTFLLNPSPDFAPAPVAPTARSIPQPSGQYSSLRSSSMNVES